MATPGAPSVLALAPAPGHLRALHTAAATARSDTEMGEASEGGITDRPGVEGYDGDYPLEDYESDKEDKEADAKRSVDEKRAVDVAAESAFGMIAQSYVLAADIVKAQNVPAEMVNKSVTHILKHAAAMHDVIGADLDRVVKKARAAESARTKANVRKQREREKLKAKLTAGSDAGGAGPSGTGGEGGEGGAGGAAAAAK